MTRLVRNERFILSLFYIRVYNVYDLVVDDEDDKMTRFYRKWADMKTRCLNPNFIEYHRYGGRGIKICERWMKYKNFEEDMLPTYKEGLSLDRIDNNGHYEPSNCKWSTRKEQSNNTKRSHPFKFRNKTMNLREWSKLLGIKRSTLAMRIYQYGWSIEKAFTKGVTN